MILSINMGVSLLLTSANITEMPYMNILKIIVSAMFGFCHFIGQCWSCMFLVCSMSYCISYSGIYYTDGIKF